MRGELKQIAAGQEDRLSAVASHGPEADSNGNPLTLHRAAWLVPVASPPLSNGAVLVRDHHILAAGPYPEVKTASPPGTREVDHGSSAIIPGLVNAHTHLELSALSGRIELPQPGFASWLTALLALRPMMTREFLAQGVARGHRELLAAGCCLCGDITSGAGLKPVPQSRQPELPTDARNDLLGSRTPTIHPPETRNPNLSDQHAIPSNHNPSAPISLISPHASPLTPHSSPTCQAFLEVLGFDRHHLADAVEDEVVALVEASPAWKVPPSLAAHACYSTAGTVIRETKEWCRTRGRPFSIHVAEHPEELQLLSHGTGFCRDLLAALDRWDPQWQAPGKTPVRYLEDLQVLDAGTLLVHAVHLTDDDWEVVARNHCPVCFCPRSNHNLTVGRPDIGKALHSGVPVALGTDSLASNTDLNLFAEMAFVLDHYPAVPAAAVVAMATLGGAEALGQERSFGSIEPGKQADLLVISVPASLAHHQLYETIIHQGTKGAWQWLPHPSTRCAWAKSAI